MTQKISILYPKGTFPAKHKLLQFLFILEFPLYFGFIKKYVFSKLKHAENIDVVPGFKFHHGNIYAKNAFLGDTVFLDSAPIYIGENSKFSWNNLVITSTHNLENFDEVISTPIHIGKNV